MLATSVIHLEQLVVPSLSKVDSLLMEGTNHESCDFSTVFNGVLCPLRLWMRANTNQVRSGPVSVYVTAFEFDFPALAALTGVLDSACVADGIWTTAVT